MEINKKIGKYLVLKDLTRSQTATRCKIDNTPSYEEICNLESVAVNCFDKIKDIFPTCFISSGFRCKVLNKKVKGSSTSQHITGEAIDIDSNSNEVNKIIFNWCQKNLDFDQLINEFEHSWTHISFKRNGKNRKQILKIK